MKAKTAIVDILKKEGTEFLTCFPGNPLIEEAAKGGIRTILARNERIALNIADGYSRVSNGQRIGLSCMQAGPGIENSFAGVAHAFADSSPILVMPGGLPMQRTGIPPGFSAVRNYQGVTKWVEQINSPRRVPELMLRAYSLLRMGKRGPVMLEVPGDVAEQEIEEGGFDYKPVRARRSAGDPADVAEAVRALLSAKAPVLYAGQGVFYAQAWDELRRLAELVQVPVMTTLNGKSVFPENHRLSAGTAGRTCPETVNHFLRKADLVFGIGTSFYRTQYHAPIPPGKVMVQVTVDSQEINKDYPVDIAIIGDAKLVLEQLIQKVEKQVGPQGRKGDDSAVRELSAVREEWLKKWMPRLTSDEVPISPYRVIWDLMNTVDRKQTIVTHDAGNPRDQMVPFYEAVAPRGYLGWGKTTTLGFGLGAMMGAKLAEPEKLCVNVMGDAAFGMVGMDFETAVRNQIPILTIVLDNGTMGGHNRALRVATERYGTSNLSGDYAKVAEGLGGYTEKVERPEELVPAFRRAIKVLESGRPALLDVITKDEPELARHTL